METQERLKCGECGATNCRIYRPYASFRRPENDLCNGCVPAKERGWYVPVIVDDSDGSIWGYSSVPDKDLQKFYALPESNEESSSWQEKGGWPGQLP